MRSLALVLPEVLSHIAAATDTETALLVAASQGGTRVYIPTRPDADHCLTKLVGPEKVRALSAALVADQGVVSSPVLAASCVLNWW